MPLKSCKNTSKVSQSSRALSLDKKIFRLSLLWMLFGFGLLALGVRFAMESFSASKAFLSNTSLEAAKLIWLPFVTKIMPSELAVPTSLLVWMGIGFLITRFFWMNRAKSLVLLMMHQKPFRRFLLGLVFTPIAMLLAVVFITPWADCAYALGVCLGLSLFNGGFVFLKFSQALKAHLPTA